LVSFSLLSYFCFYGFFGHIYQNTNKRDKLIILKVSRKNRRLKISISKVVILVSNYFDILEKSEIVNK
jgi:hypothetical protein